MNTVILQIQATGDCMRLGFLNTEAWSLQELVIAGQVLAIARQELVIARSCQSDEAIKPPCSAPRIAVFQREVYKYVQNILKIQFICIK